MNIIENWTDIRSHFTRSFRTSLHVSIASVDSNNHPSVTPIGSLFLNHDQTGFYFEKFPSKLPVHSKENNRICVLGVNSKSWFWLKSLFRGKFARPPAIKLYGTLGEKRTATPEEMYALKRRMRMTKGMKGHQYLWRDMQDVRLVSFDKAERIHLGKMTD